MSKDEKIIEVKNIKDIPKNIIEILTLNMSESNDDLNPESFEDIREFIFESGDSKEYLDSGYLITDYILKFTIFDISVSGYQYRKDGGLCDFELEEEIYITLK